MRCATCGQPTTNVEGAECPRCWFHQLRAPRHRRLREQRPGERPGGAVVSITRDCDEIIRMEVVARGAAAASVLDDHAGRARMVAECDESDSLRQHDPAIARRAVRRYSAAAWALRSLARG